ncbi:gallate dioxygenase [Solimonas marina]|uniref:Gallate dioxygenase n=1 Tax=Solimonas marina TaxID=2714601 RepID=A0A970BB89_9GAMM|nr:gallate dioxygenase [Solimonas marina]NKF24141.1 gallate dioxygenase [Solimonas marina]
MARIIGGIGVSHTPTIGFAYDTHKQKDPAWAPIFDGFEPVRCWLAERKPDAVVYIFNDHVTSFFFDHYSTFALGIDREYRVADEGGGARHLPAMPGHPELSRHIAMGLAADEFDMSYFQDKPLDHGFFSPMSVLLDREGGQWPTRVVPLQIGVLQFPIPSASRCYKLGQAVRRAIECYPEDIDVAIIATGGLSHQVHGERSGFNNVEWDRAFVEAVARDPQSLLGITHAEYATLGGLEGAEVIMWLVMRGALSSNVKVLHNSAYLPSVTNIATLLLENEAQVVPEAELERRRQRMGAQLRGIDNIEGTYPFDHARSLKGYRVNKFLHDLVEPAKRERFRDDQDTAMRDAGLSDEECDFIRRLDWRAMIRYGVSFFVMEKLAAVVGVPNPQIYAAMRGESLEDFLKTRNTQVTYSVAGDVPENGGG